MNKIIEMLLKSLTQKLLILSQVCLVVFTVQLRAQNLSEIESRRVSLPNGWHLTPVGTLLPLGDLPLNIAIAPSEKIAAVTNGDT